MQPFHKVYYRILDMFARGQIRKLIVTMSPQHGKSEGSSRNLPAEMLGMNPDLKIALGSYSTTMARKFQSDVQRIMSGERYTELYPESAVHVKFRSTLYKRNADLYEIPEHKGSFYTVGRGGPLTGQTVDVAILDDVYKDYAEGNSPVIREAAWRWYTSVVRTRLHNRSQELIVFTRWNSDDIIGRIQQSDEKVVTVRTWNDVRKVKPDEWCHLNFEAIKTGEPTELDTRQPGEPLWPQRHSLKKLEDYRRLDVVQFNCLYQGNPASAEGKLYRPFNTWTDKKDYGRFIRSGAYTDVADEGSDFLSTFTYDIYLSPTRAFNINTKRYDPVMYVLITDMDYTDANTDVTIVTQPEIINRAGV